MSEFINNSAARTEALAAFTRGMIYRNDAGVCKGTIEVSQDVTGIRLLEGERRLLEWIG